MNEPNCYVILFASTHHALSGEKALKDAGIRHAVVNTPREFSVDCGISLRIETGLKDEAASALDKAGVVYMRMEPYHSCWK